jgi:glucose/arabinose dehydrogenase
VRTARTAGVRLLVGALALTVVLAGCAPSDDAPASDPSVGPSPSHPTPAPSAPDRPSPSPDDEMAPGLPPADRPLPTFGLVEVGRFEAPIDTAVLPDGTVLVAERAGRVLTLGGGDVVLDVRDRTTTDGERGLLAIAVHPDGRELFVSMTDRAGDTLVEAHPLEGRRAVGPARTIYALPQPFANHNGGPILFTPDGLLLLGLGDGGGAGDPLRAGQDLSTPLGAILRLAVDGGAAGRAPEDNPFLDVPGAAPEIAAYGLRNPWRMSLDVPRGELWIADVGQSAREEINRIALDDLLGANFGWALREGGERFLGDEPADHVRPVFDYPHGPGCSVTGGHVYRGAAIPALVGAYVFTDLCDGELRALLDADGSVVARGLGVRGERIIGFGRDADGELLVLEIGGRVLRLVTG